MREGWNDCRLADAVEVTMGRQRSPKHATGEHVVPYLRAANVKDGRLDLSDVKTMNFSLGEQATFQLQVGDVLVTEGCGSLKQLGAAATWGGEIAGAMCFQNTLLRLRAIDRVTVPGFVAVWASHAFATGAFAAVASGTNIFHIGSTRAKQMTLRVPPLDEQRRIVDLIDAANDSISASLDVARLARDALLRHLEGLASTETRRFGALAEMGSGPSWKSDQETPVPQEGGLPVIGITNTTADGRLDLAERKFVTGLSTKVRTLTEHSLILIRTNGNRQRIGNVYRATADLAGSAVSAFQIAVEPADPSSSDYLYWALASPTAQGRISDVASGTTGLGNVAIKWLREFEIPWLGDQGRENFVGAADTLFEIQRAAENEARSLRRLRASLLGELLSGEHEIAPAYDELLEAV